jgi:16S rRNA (adenine1518-N6/adenine1519-N6)-dimethyltransferase
VSDLVLEVGPGVGVLTCLIAARGAAVLAVELDPTMAELARETVSGRSSVEVLSADALAGKNTLNPIVVDRLRAMQPSLPERRFKLVANLPYNVATPIITNLLVHQEFCPDLMVVTIQRELAERMIAAPSTSAYGALSVLLQALAGVLIVRVLQPSVFWPRPKVESAVVSIRPDLRRRAEMNVSWFHNIVRNVFLHRRKSLRSVVSSIWPDLWKKAEADVWLRSIGLDGQLRAEALDINQFRCLAEGLERVCGNVQTAASISSVSDKKERASRLKGGED